MNGVPRHYQITFWLGGIIFAPALFYFDIRQLDGIHLTVSHLIVGRDFFNVWTGGNLALSNSLDILYDYDGYRAWQAARFGVLDPYNYSYPPSSLFLATMFGAMPYVVALLLWTLLGAAFFYWAARPYMPRNLAPICAILTPAALVNIWAGHYGFVIGGLWLLFFSLIAHRPVRSGIIAGLLTLKPHLGLLIAVVMLYRRTTWGIVAAIVTTSVLIGASGFVFGFDLWYKWLVDTSALQTKIMTAPGERFYYLMMPSIYIALRHAPSSVAIIGQAAMTIAALALLWKARRAVPQDLAFLTASATALIAPYIFNYDLTVANLGFVVFLYKKWDHLRAWERYALWVAFASPLLGMLVNVLAPFALLLGFIVQVRRAEEHRSGMSAPNR